MKLKSVYPQRLIQDCNDRHRLISRMLKKYTAAKKVIIARRNCERLKNIFDMNLQFSGIVLTRTTKVEYGISPSEMMDRIIKIYLELVRVEQMEPNVKTHLQITEFAAYYAIWYRNTDKLNGTSQKDLLTQLLKEILPPEKVSNKTNEAKVYNKLHRRANDIMPIEKDACRSKVRQYIRTHTRSEL